MTKIFSLLCLTLLVLSFLGCAEDISEPTASMTTSTITTGMPTTTITTIYGVVNEVVPIDIRIESGEVDVEPYPILSNAYYYNGYGGWSYADGEMEFGGFNILDHAQNLPSLSITQAVTITVGEHSEWSDPFLYDELGMEIGSISLQDIEFLESGTYILRIFLDLYGGFGPEVLEYYNYYCFTFITLA